MSVLVRVVRQFVEGSEPPRLEKVLPLADTPAT
jgi:hypothetical protein